MIFKFGIFSSPVASTTFRAAIVSRGVFLGDLSSVLQGKDGGFPIATGPAEGRCFFLFSTSQIQKTKKHLHRNESTLCFFIFFQRRQGEFL